MLIPLRSPARAVQNEPLVLGIKQATAAIQKVIANREGGASDEVDRRDALLDAGQAGDPAARQESVRLLADMLRRYGISVVEDGHDVPPDQAAHAIWRYLYGLDVIQDLYDDPEIDEVRVNRPDYVSVQRRGKNERVAVRFKDAEHVKKIILRVIRHDRASIDRSSPRVESVRPDGTRVTATIPPFSHYPTLVLRKHGTFDLTEPNLIRAGTAEQRLLRILALLTRGRANMLLSGPTGSAKTSLLRYLVRFYDPRLRIVSLETDVELRLAAAYPDRDIVELEEHPELDPPLTMRQAFRTVLRLTPSLILIGEVRGHGEAQETVNACLRGHDGSIATIHTSSPEDAIEQLATMIVAEGKQLPLPLLKLQVARAFNIVVQMFTSETKGIKKVERVTEVRVENDQLRFVDLAVWVPGPADWFTGRWEYPNPPSAQLIARLVKHGVSLEDLPALGWS